MGKTGGGCIGYMLEEKMCLGAVVRAWASWRRRECRRRRSLWSSTRTRGLLGVDVGYAKSLVSQGVHVLDLLIATEYWLCLAGRVLGADGGAILKPVGEDIDVKVVGSSHDDTGHALARHVAYAWTLQDLGLFHGFTQQPALIFRIVRPCRRADRGRPSGWRRRGAQSSPRSCRSLWAALDSSSRGRRDC